MAGSPQHNAAFFEAARLMLKIELTGIVRMADTRCSFSELVQCLNALVERVSTLKPGPDQ